MYSLTRISKGLLSVAIVAMFGAVDVAAQACIGSPANGGGYAVAAEVGLLEGATAYGGGVQANLVGPISVGASYALVDLDDVEENFNSIGGNVAWELSAAGLSACPLTGVDYTWHTEETNGVESSVSSTVLPVGLGIGKSFSVAGFSVMPYATPQFLYMRSSIEQSGGVDPFENTTTSEEFGSEVGAVLSMQNLFVGGGVMITTVEDSDPTYSIGAGITF